MKEAYLMRELYYLSLFFIFSISLSSCQKEKQKKSFRVGFSQCCDDAWRDEMNSEMYRELSIHPELDFEFRVANGKSEKQIQQIKELMDLDLDLLIVAPNESDALTEVVDEVYKKGIHVILIDRATESNLYTAYTGGDNYEIGRTAANYIASQFKGKGEIVVIQFPLTISPGFERKRGFQDALKKYPDLELVETIEEEAFLADSEVLIRTLDKHPNAKIIFAMTDFLAETSYKIAQKKGLATDLFFVGVDGIPGTGRGIQAVEDGILDASLLYPTGGSEAIQLALSILNNLPFQRINLLPTTVIDASNARILQYQMKKVKSLQGDIDVRQKGVIELTADYRQQRYFNLLLISGLALFIALGGLLWRALSSKQRAYKLLEEKNKEVNEKQEALLKVSEELKLATQAKVDFFTNISHEFRTPLTLILSFTEDLIFSSSKLSNEVKRNIQPIKENAFRLLRLVNQLMDFRKIDSGKMVVQASNQDMIAFIRQIMNSYFRIAERREIEFKLITRHEKVMVWFDPNMMDKVLFNILSNAFKFTPNQGKITISVMVDSFEEVIKIKIDDTGKGISKEELNHVFKPFYQGKHSKTKGTGLGLPFSLSLVKLHSGDILLKSIKKKGSRFTILLPLGKEHFTKHQIKKENTKYEVSETYANISTPTEFIQKPSFEIKSKEGQYHILLIEDNHELTALLNSKLGKKYNLYTASAGNEGVKLAFEKTPDLVICDINLPDKNGIEITEMLKDDLRTSHIPIILLTARSTMEQQLEGIKAGSDAYIIKPFNFRLLEENIVNLLHNRKLLKQSYSNNLQVFHENNPMTSIDQQFLKKFMDYIEACYTNQDFQMTDLCEAMSLSRSQLFRKIKSLIGESPTEYVKNFRLRKAETLLLNPNLSISEIAYEVGYSSPDYFTTVFKSKHEMVPSEYRKIHTPK